MNFKQPYNRDEFLSFVKDLIPEFTKDTRPVSLGNGYGAIKSANFLGASGDLDLSIFELKIEGKAEKKIHQAKEGFKLMKEHQTYRALAVYYSEDDQNWRLSLMQMTPEKTETGRISQKFSNPRRYSFYLGPKAKTKTPENFLIKKGVVKDFEDLLSRFSVEVVNKEFYKEISQVFSKLVDGLLKLPAIQDKDQTSLEFAVRLIGRIIFCWFLREKKSAAGLALMPKELLSLEATRTNENYYHKILEPIFFEVLNKTVKSRREDFASEHFLSIPYLNGGLFSPQDDDYYKRTSNDFQSQYHNTLVIPDNWFKDFFEILETYNFTIDENTSYDEELSIDPEMLGRIFENLLAEINPETGESARKSTGSYYTPRIIVNYMVDESLLLYLKNLTGISDEKLKAVISYDLMDDSRNPINEDEKESIINALEKVKILDPACGSGAFPMGALQKIVFILQQTDPDGQMWFKKQIVSTPPEMRRVIEREFAHKNFDYIRKLGIIRENIYGVDIQPIATEISRLRCFLTLIVDERIQDESENRGIEPLPNLDFKFVAANSLIGLPKIEQSQKSLLDDYEKIDDLKQIREQYFNASGIEREQLKTEFVTKQKRLFMDLQSEFGWAGIVKAELTNKLSDWDPFAHRSTSWFDPEWMFGIKNGFDIVIANPPYDVYQGEKKEDIELIKKLDIYAVSRGGKLNAYKLFLARSSQLQKDKAVLCEIFQNSFLGDNSAKLLREYFLTNQKIIQIDSFPERDNHKKRVFEAVKMSVCILVSNKEKVGDYSFRLNVWDSKYMDNGFTVDYSKTEIQKFDPVSLQIPLLDRNEKSLFSKVYNHPHAPISCIEGELNMTFHKKYFCADSNGPKIIKGAAIQRYHITDNLSQGKVEYLNENLYLKDFGSSKKSNHHKSPRLVLQGITGVDDRRRLIMTYLPDGFYCANSCNYILSNDSNYRLNYLLGLYNSKLINWIFKKTSTNSNVNCYEIENLPIPSMLQSNVQTMLKVDELVDNILKNDQRDTKGYEQQIDQMVYKLYDLTPEEIKIIEESGK